MHNLTFTLFGSDGSFREPEEGEMVFFREPNGYKTTFEMRLGWIATASACAKQIIIDFWE